MWSHPLTVPSERSGPAFPLLLSAGKILSLGPARVLAVAITSRGVLAFANVMDGNITVVNTGAVTAMLHLLG